MCFIKSGRNYVFIYHAQFILLLTLFENTFVIETVDYHIQGELYVILLRKNWTFSEHQKSSYYFQQFIVYNITALLYKQNCTNTK